MLQQVALAVGFIVLGTHVCSSTFVDIDKNMPPFTVCVEFAVFQFNEQQEDEFAYKFLRVRRSQRQKLTWIYLMDVEMGRTICKKHDEDIDNCPLQEGEGEKMVRCTFIVDAKPWNFQYTILKSNCTKN